MAIQIVFFDLGDTLVKTSNKTWLPGAKQLLATLKAKGFKLGVLSNTGNLSRNQILALLPNDFSLNDFESDLVLFSSEVGLSKPDPEIFKKAVNVSGIAASKCIYCSESLIETLSAQSAGMFAMRVQPPPGNDLADVEPRLQELNALLPPPS